MLLQPCQSALQQPGSSGSSARSSILPSRGHSPAAPAEPEASASPKEHIHARAPDHTAASAPLEHTLARRPASGLHRRSPPLRWHLPCPAERWARSWHFRCRRHGNGWTGHLGDGRAHPRCRRRPDSSARRACTEPLRLWRRARGHGRRRNARLFFRLSRSCRRADDISCDARRHERRPCLRGRDKPLSPPGRRIPYRALCALCRSQRTRPEACPRYLSRSCHCRSRCLDCASRPCLEASCPRPCHSTARQPLGRRLPHRAGRPHIPSARRYRG